MLDDARLPDSPVPYILALDLASHTGVAHGAVAQKPTLSSVRLGYANENPQESFGRAVRWIASLLKSLPVTHVFIEAPIAPQVLMGKSNPATSMLLLGLYGCVSGHVRARGLPLTVVPVATWRKAFIGAGQLPSGEAKRRGLKQCQMLGWDAGDHDAADAAGLWSYGCGLLCPLLRIGSVDYAE